MAIDIVVIVDKVVTVLMIFVCLNGRAPMIVLSGLF